MDSIRHLEYSFVILILIIGLGTFGYALIEGWPLFDSLYMTVITLATVGYGEVHPLSPSGRVFTLFLIFSGSASSPMRSVVWFSSWWKGSFARYWGGKNWKNRSSKLEGHYIICGYGRIGGLICKEFQARPLPFVVVEKDPGLCEKLANEGRLFVAGDATDDETLVAAGIRRAKGLITAVTSDTENVYITLTARGLNPDLFILARAGEEGSEKKLRRAGASKVISPYIIGATRMAQAVLRPSVVDFIEIATAGKNLELQLEEIRVAADSHLVQKTLVSSGVRREWGIIIVGIKKGRWPDDLQPQSTTLIDAGDILITLGERTAILNLERVASGEVPSV